jgi:hypothetical protein
MTISLRRLSVVVVLALVATMFAAFPAAFAALDSGKTTSVTLDVDGNTVDLAKSVTNNAGDPFSGGFGGTGTGDNNKGDLVTGFFPERGGKLVRLLAQGGIQEISCSGGGEEYYQRARVTLSGVPSSARVWAFYDESVGNKQYATFQENPDDDGVGGPDLANDRIDEAGSLPKLCDGTTHYVAGGTLGTINLGSNEQAENPSTLTTAGTYKDVGGADNSVAFDVYVPMEGTAGQSTSIFLALGFVVDAPDVDGAYGLDDATADVGITAWVSSRPWWLASEEKNEAHTLLSPCLSPSASADPCIIESASGIFGAGDGIRDDSGYSVELESIMDAPSLEARLTLAPTAAIGSSGFSVPDGSIAKISVSWPTSGVFLGGPVAVGDGANQLDFSIALADTPIKVDPKTTSNSSETNRWDIVSSGDRVITTLIGEAKSTSSGISQNTWWPQCSVGFDGGAVISENCGADMTSNVSDGFMVFSSVPAEVNLMINAEAAPIAGGLVSTNGQGFAFGPETFSATAFQFAVSGPSFKADGSSRATDGFYYVCIPGTFLDGGFDTTSTVAAANWSGTRDGAASGGTAFAVGNCGVGADGAGLVAELDPFGYSSPLFRLAPTTNAIAPTTTTIAPTTPGTAPVSCGLPPAPPCNVRPGINFGPGNVISNPNALTGSDMANLRPDNFVGFRPADARLLGAGALQNFQPSQFGALPPTAMAGFDRGQISNLNPAAMAGMSKDQMAALPASAMGGFNANQMAALPPSAMAGFDPTRMAALPPSAMGGFNASQMGQLPPTAMAGFNSSQMSASAITGMQEGQFAALPPQAMIGFKPAQFAALPPDAISGMQRNQFRVIPAKAMAAFTPTQMDAMPVGALAVISPSQFKALTPAVIASMSPEQRSALPRQALNPAANAAPANTGDSAALARVLTGWNVDKVPATAFANFKPADAAKLSPQVFSSLNPEQFKAMPAAAFTGMKPNQVGALPPDVLATLKPTQLASMPAAALGSLNTEQFSAMPPAAFTGMKPTQVGAMPAALISNMSSQQVGALPARAMAGLKAEQVSALPPEAMATMKPAQVGALKPAAVASLSADQVGALPAAAFGAMKPTQVGAMPAALMATMSPQQVGALPATAMAGLKAEQVSALPPEAIATMKPKQVAKLKPATAAGFSNEKLAALTPAQTRKLKPAFVNALTPEQKAALNS